MCGAGPCEIQRDYQRQLAPEHSHTQYGRRGHQDALALQACDT